MCPFFQKEEDCYAAPSFVLHGIDIGIMPRNQDWCEYSQSIAS